MRLSRHCWAELHCRQPIGDQPHRECKAEDHSTSGLGVAMSGALKPAWLAEDSLGGSESAEHEETVPHSIPTLPIWVLLCGAQSWQLLGWSVTSATSTHANEWSVGCVYHAVAAGVILRNVK